MNQLDGDLFFDWGVFVECSILEVFDEVLFMNF